ncbi:IucA/IucC family C-terminal-domain containing protein [Streptacidiphilus sp. P02-A3a]|uniref:IucA/IucC family C-terminal-domain containing protein n=1 Tax=Streptacidiphilus sp. P02-A3a TaxID=2704468 RepID=UPI0015FE4035|nr:IucA/IucC family C-terminal-domain containing protein [Streptacidiphilus sp. P02-A3a]QMU71760.1 hypothetical protein GXP74_29460 [Streptacidiphilus sp. P02-A3a]
MDLDDADSPLAFWRHAERYLGGGTRTYSSSADFMDISPLCHPQLGAPSFAVPSFHVPWAAGSLLTSGIPSGLTALYQIPGGFLLPVHPDALSYPGLVGREELLALEPGPVFDVVPSANGRTVFVSAVDGTAVPEHLLKLHYPRRLSRFTRRLREPVIRAQLWAAEELTRAGLPILAEVCGGVFGSGDDAWGFIVRELPPATVAGDRFTVPLFALYGDDVQAPGGRSLVEQLVAAGGSPAGSLLAERIVEPMVELWVRAALETGCALEMHGQNTLLSFTPDLREVEVLYRDCDVYVDPALRARNGLTSLPPTGVISKDVPFPANQVFSLTYDSFMGHHALDYLARLARERLGVAPDALHAAARRAFTAATGEAHRGLLPDTVYYYDNELRPRGAWNLVNTGRRPQWR